VGRYPFGRGERSLERALAVVTPGQGLRCLARPLACRAGRDDFAFGSDLVPPAEMVINDPLYMEGGLKYDELLSGARA
jgi:hypothetical protein